MSQSFTVKATRDLPFGEILALADLTPLDLDVDAQPEVREQLLGDEPVYVAGPLTGRGFGVSEEGGEYVVRINTPAASTDWQTALRLLSGLAQACGSDIVDEGGQSWTASTIADFDYRHDILAGVQAMAANTPEGEEGMLLHGAVRPVAIRAQDWRAMLATPDPVATFDASLAASQEPDAEPR